MKQKQTLELSAEYILIEDAKSEDAKSEDVKRKEREKADDTFANGGVAFHLETNWEGATFEERAKELLSFMNNSFVKPSTRPFAQFGSPGEIEFDQPPAKTN